MSCSLSRLSSILPLPTGVSGGADGEIRMDTREQESGRYCGIGCGQGGYSYGMARSGAVRFASVSLDGSGRKRDGRVRLGVL